MSLQETTTTTAFFFLFCVQMERRRDISASAQPFNDDVSCQIRTAKHAACDCPLMELNTFEWVNTYAGSPAAKNDAQLPSRTDNLVLARLIEETLRWKRTYDSRMVHRMCQRSPASYRIANWPGCIVIRRRRQTGRVRCTWQHRHLFRQSNKGKEMLLADSDGNKEEKELNKSF